MARPRKNCHIRFDPSVTYFKPRGVPLNLLKEVHLKHDELEAIRLKYVEGMDQTVCAVEMKISQSTFQRILSSANRKTAKALVQGQAIKITNTNTL